MEILDTTIATASLRHIAVGGAVAVGLGLALADFLIGRRTVHFGTRWLVLLQTVLWISTLIYVIATILRAIFASREVAVETRLAALCVFLLTGLLGAFAFTLIDLMSPGSFRASHGPVFAWADERSRTTEFMHLFVFSYATLSGSNCAVGRPGDRIRPERRIAGGDGGAGLPGGRSGPPRRPARDTATPHHRAVEAVARSSAPIIALRTSVRRHRRREACQCVGRSDEWHVDFSETFLRKRDWEFLAIRRR